MFLFFPDWSRMFIVTLIIMFILASANRLKIHLKFCGHTSRDEQVKSHAETRLEGDAGQPKGPKNLRPNGQDAPSL